MSNLLVNHSFEEPIAGGDGWYTSGNVMRVDESAFEGDWVAALQGQGVNVISQLIRVPNNADWVQVVYSIRPNDTVPYAMPDGDFQLQIQWFGSANAGLPLLRTDVVDVVHEENMDDAWWTRVLASAEKPPNTVWARLRFILTSADADSSIFLDNVYATGEAP